MPTTHVEPSSDSLLQDIANSLGKARKVVVITGAGISTNSGIPDFRSENGLYSLIQAQFDAVAKQATSSDSDADVSDAFLDGADERPAKRRRLSRDETSHACKKARQYVPGTRETSREDIVQETIHVAEELVPVEDTIHVADPDETLAETDELEVAVEDTIVPTSHVDAKDTDTRPASRQDVAVQDVERVEHAPGPPGKQPHTERARTPCEPDTGCIAVETGALPSPRLSSEWMQLSRDDDTAEDVKLELPVHPTSVPPRLTLQLQSEFHWSRPDTICSSPLSSPPPIAFDPYEDSSSSSSSQDGMSSRSQSEEPSSTSTPLLTSQSCYGSTSGRTTLPNLKGKDLFDAQIWGCPTKTSVFYTFATTLRQKAREAEPTSSHQFMSVLRDSRKLVRCYTQNIDRLEERVGLSTSLTLGAGSRYRFSARAGRSSGMGRASLKEAESSGLEQSQEGSQQDPSQRSDEDSAESQAQSREGKDEDQPPPQQNTDTRGDPKEEIDGTTEEGQSASGAVPNNAAASTPSGTATAAVPSGPNRGVECVLLHGSLAELRCFVCGRTCPWDEDSRETDTLAGRQPACPHCAGATAAREGRGKRALGVGKLRPDIVLYGEEHPHAHLISPIVQHDLSLGPDMLLILGTSMRVHGLKVLIREFAKAVHDRGGKVVFVNFTKPPESVWADIIDFWVQWDCDAWVGDLQQRKPALWTPPGTAIVGDEKGKLVKASRKDSRGDVGKCRDSDKAVSLKRRESGGQPSKPRREDSGLVGETTKDSETAQTPSEIAQPEQKPSPPKSAKPARKPPNVPREPKLNPNAKRPASIRDHKLNGAYLVWKIMGDLRRITDTDGSGAQSAESSPAADKGRPKTRRTRKSAPAAIAFQGAGPVERRKPRRTRANRLGNNNKVEERDGEETEEDEAPQTPSAGLDPSLLEAGNAASAMVDPESSISAAVKSRKRKQTVTWKMIRGVEVKVPLHHGDGGGDPLSYLADIAAASSRSTSPTMRRSLPKPRNTRKSLPATLLLHEGGVHEGVATPKIAPLALADEPQPAFYETDRLIAQLTGQSLLLEDDRKDVVAKELRHDERVFRPMTPPVQLAPLKTGQQVQRKREAEKLQPLEPKVASPGPLTELLSPDVGSPVAGVGFRRFSSNPFFFADPLAGYFGFSPWRDQQYKQRGGGHGVREQQEGSTGDDAGAVGPDEQLRKEQEAAMMLSMLRGG
ncbi:NAD-dependent histone deacetylase HST3 [Diplogelasinospora grovesii]|uniref:NAD-dependent histone deacetylase HST3 n=1 Tax=Diplogelasinospora grovesii TaxID=303347 RepID=A0AAN6S318_9PEZI|nr:NAD-dependent histone deacetylase HST3 [Diplogelasinospora grovesii]